MSERSIVFVDPNRRRHTYGRKLTGEDFWQAQNSHEAKRLVKWLRDLGISDAKAITLVEANVLLEKTT